jgi:hypothetical protein
MEIGRKQRRFPWRFLVGLILLNALIFIWDRVRLRRSTREAPD